MNKKNAVLAVLLGILLGASGLSLSFGKSSSRELRRLEVKDILAWKSIRSAVVSNNGEWFAYCLSPNEGDSEIVIRKTKEEKEFRFPAGDFPRFFFQSGMIAFSEDSRWAAFTVFPDVEATKKLRKENQEIFSRAALVNLLTGEKIEFGNVKKFTFPGENSSWLVLHKYPPAHQAKEKWSGSDLILYDLPSGNELNIGNVSEFVIDKKGLWLAWIIDAQEKTGNGVQARNMTTGRVILLDSDQAVYKRLNWNDKGDGLAVLKGIEDDQYEEDLFSVIGFADFSGAVPKRVVYDPKKDKTFPQDMAVSPDRSPSWTDDLMGILFGIHESKKKQEISQEQNEKTSAPEVENIEEKTKIGDEEELTDLVIWHWLDKRSQAQQRLEEEKDKSYSYLCVYRVKDDKFIRLADDALREVIPAAKHRWAVGFDEREYELQESLNGHGFRDIYVVDLKTGDRRLAVKKCRHRNPFSLNEGYYGTSPDGTHFLYYDDGHFYTHEMGTGQSYDITKDVPTSFVDEGDDTNNENSPIMPVGWAKDGGSVLLYDGWDVWKVPVHGGKGTNMTANGKKEGIRYGYDSFRANRFIMDPEEDGIDLSGPVYFGAYGEWTKKGGIARINNGQPGAKMLLWDEAHFEKIFKAKKADVFLYMRESQKDFPDCYVTDSSFQNGRRIMEANPQQKEFLWSGGSMLIDYTGAKGQKLQAALFLPAGYEKGKRYPTIVHIYEKLSQNLNRYQAPGLWSFNAPFYTSRSYAVLMPDIAYKVDDPAMSAVWCVLPAVEAAIATGVVDKDRMGIQGHSWGGYQTAFLITQTYIFKAAVAGAPLTNVISLYNLIYGYGGRGLPQHMLFESGQSRFSKGYWDNFEAFARNSPVLFADRVKTPLLMFHNDKDEAVDWNQGVEYYSALRRLQKPVIMLQYRGEGHSPTKPASQKDYFTRESEFFDHYLQGRPAPGWMLEGVPYLRMKEHLKERSRRE